MQATPTRLIDFVGWHRDTDKNGNAWPENEEDSFIQECVLVDAGRHCDDRAGSKEDNQNFYRGNCQIGRVRVAKWVAVQASTKTAEIENTPEMIEAGVDEFYESCSGDVELLGSLTAHDLVRTLVSAALSGQDATKGKQ